MKKLAIILISCSTIFYTSLKAQDTDQDVKVPVIYTVAFNAVPDGFNAPLIGFVNIAKGDHKNLQLGFANTNYRNLSGAQLGFINTVGANTSGLQAGFINTTGASLKGLQYGFLNTVGSNTGGIQAGFLNTTAGSMQGAQFGFINTVIKESSGIQAGFINTSAKEIKGAQFGFVNLSRKLSGLQLGFINVIDTLETGIPIGFLSFVRHNGFQAIELSANEMFPISVSFKTGVKHFYTSLIASYNPGMKRGFATGVGLGSIISISDAFYFNPELNTVNSLGKDFYKTSSLSPAFGFVLAPKLHLIAGPSISWYYSNIDGESSHPILPLYEYESDTNSELIVGFRLALRYSFREF